MKKAIIFLFMAMPLLASCGGTSVARLDTGSTVDLSGRWNDADSRMAAEELIDDCLSSPWLTRARAAKGDNPTVIVGGVRNKSNEHINTGVLVQDLQRALIKSGKVDFVASGSDREAIRNERFDQAVNASEETRKEHGQEAGADFMLNGTIQTIEDREGGKSVILYQVDMQLQDMTSNKIVWSGQKKIKKQIKRSSSKW